MQRVPEQREDKFHPADALAAQDADDRVIAGCLEVPRPPTSGDLKQVIDELIGQRLRAPLTAAYRLSPSAYGVVAPCSRSRKLNSWMRFRCWVCVLPWPCSR
jgi:hypothetical protein